MTQDQERHLNQIKEQFESRVDKKYRAGVLEHGGNLWELTELALIENALDESIDLVTYLLSTRDKLLARTKS